MTGAFKISSKVIPHQLKFKFDAGTSRGVLRTKGTYFIKVASTAFPGIAGYGEAGPLPGLSVDDTVVFMDQLTSVLHKIETFAIPNHEKGILDLVASTIPDFLPSARFAVETALLDLINGGKKRILPNNFFDRQQPIPINGLIWMGEKDFMLQQIREKLEGGYNCIKIKIGAIDFKQECGLLRYIRSKYGPEDVSLRVDANGAFGNEEALQKLDQLSKYALHSIEQPIKQGNVDKMASLCQNTPVPIALDEELIGINGIENKLHLLEAILPQYIILKPTLLGGIIATQEWIKLASERNIGWWMTSALESNIGLNAIAQLASTFNPILPQGLGTGQLYHNNIGSPLKVANGSIIYQKDSVWDLLGY
jgi:o-succinylbenzoate synthase